MATEAEGSVTRQASNLVRGLFLEWLLVLGAMLLAVSLGLPNLENNPPLSYDEGYVLQAPHNLLTEHFYGTRTLDGELPFDTHISTGPTVLVPIWFSFLLFGEGLAQARVVVLLYSALAVAACFLLVRQMEGKWVAFLGALLLSLSLYPYNRSVLGEAPGLFWLLLGGWLWAKTVQERPRAGGFLMAGLAFGMAALTKLALGPLIGATLVLCWALARVRALPPRLEVRTLGLTFFAMSVPLLGWYSLQWAVLGTDELTSRILTIGEYQSQMLGPSWSRIANNVRALPSVLPSGLLPWVASGLLLAILRFVQGGYRVPAASLLVVFMGTSTAWYLLSVGWSRYSFWVACIAAILVAPLAHFFLPPGQGKQGTRWKELSMPLVSAGVGIALLFPFGVSAFTSLGLGDEEVQRTAGFLNERADQEEVLGSTEHEMDFLTKRLFRHPPTFVATVSKDAVQKKFDWSWPGVDWVVVGPIGRFLGAETQLQNNPRFVERFAGRSYRVFQRYAGPPPGWLWSRRGATRTPPLLEGSPVGQSFRAPYGRITEIRVLLAGEGRENNAAVRLTLYAGRERPTPLAVATISGAEIVENKWYTFHVGRMRLDRGSEVYFELTSDPRPDEAPVNAWFNSSEDYYPEGQWYRNRQPRPGDIYFGILGDNKGMGRRQFTYLLWE